MPQAKKGAPAPDDAPDAAAAHGADERLIKKYPNRRLYDTRHSAYITLQDVKTLVLGAERFRVVDAKTGEDLTRAILLQIILEEETGGVPLFSAEMLSNIIRVYGHAMQGMMGQLLAKNIELMTQLQGQLTEHSKGFYEQSAFHPEAWTQLLQSQTPIMQNMLGGAAEQSRQAFVKMQDDFQRQLQQAFSPDQFFRHMPGFKKPGQE